MTDRRMPEGYTTYPESLYFDGKSKIPGGYLDGKSAEVAFPGPRNSEDFLPPAHKSHASMSDEEARAQNEDRERMCCAVALDIQYELSVLADETGAYKQRLQPFNPRMSGPACPYNYTGKFVPESVHEELGRDPIKLGREIAKQDPYDKKLYCSKDPRLLSKTVVVRDYGCKIPLQLKETQNIAKAVLTNYPDQYIAFLDDFVSNCFGSTMQDFLENYINGFEKLLAMPDELNKLSWAVYASVQGGVDETQEPAAVANNWEAVKNAGANVAPRPPGPNYNNTSADEVWPPLHTDRTLLWRGSMGTRLNEVTRNGDAMSSQIDATDVFDIRPCIKSHMETLRIMKDEWCKGYATDESHALAMLYWINEQGRNYGEDLRLLEHGRPDYRRVTLHVPYNLNSLSDKDLKTQQPLGTQRIPNPDMNTSIRSSLIEDSKTLHETDTLIIPVGSWCGKSSSTYVDASDKADYSWGFGHCATVMTRYALRQFAGTTDNKTSSANFWDAAPFLRYATDAKNQQPAGQPRFVVVSPVDGKQSGVTYVRPDKYKFVNVDPNLVANSRDIKQKEVVDKANKPETKTVRDSLRFEPRPVPGGFFRGSASTVSNAFSDASQRRTYGALDRADYSEMQSFPVENNNKEDLNAQRNVKLAEDREFADYTRDFIDKCEGGSMITTINNKRFKSCEYLSPFLRGPATFGAPERSSSSFTILFKYLRGFDFKSAMDSPVLSKALTSFGVTPGVPETFAIAVRNMTTRLQNIGYTSPGNPLGFPLPPNTRPRRSGHLVPFPSPYVLGVTGMSLAPFTNSGSDHYDHIEYLFSSFYDHPDGVGGSVQNTSYSGGITVGGVPQIGKGVTQHAMRLRLRLLNLIPFQPVVSVAFNTNVAGTSLGPMALGTMPTQASTLSRLLAVGLIDGDPALLDPAPPAGVSPPAVLPGNDFHNEDDVYNQYCPAGPPVLVATAPSGRAFEPMLSRFEKDITMVRKLNKALILILRYKGRVDQARQLRDTILRAPADYPLARYYLNDFNPLIVSPGSYHIPDCASKTDEEVNMVPIIVHSGPAPPGGAPPPLSRVRMLAPFYDTEIRLSEGLQLFRFWANTTYYNSVTGPLALMGDLDGWWESFTKEAVRSATNVLDALELPTPSDRTGSLAFLTHLLTLWTSAAPDMSTDTINKLVNNEFKNNPVLTRYAITPHDPIHPLSLDGIGGAFAFVLQQITGYSANNVQQSKSLVDNLVFAKEPGVLGLRQCITPRRDFSGDLFGCLKCSSMASVRAIENQSEFNVNTDSLPVTSDTNVDTSFDDLDTLNALKMQLLTLREVLSHSLGMVLASVICETTFMNDPLMQYLVNITQSDLPLTDSTNHPALAGWTTYRLSFDSEMECRKDPVDNLCWYFKGSQLTGKSAKLHLLRMLLRNIHKNYTAFMTGTPADREQLCRRFINANRAFFQGTAFYDSVMARFRPSGGKDVDAKKLPPELACLTRRSDDLCCLYAPTWEEYEKQRKEMFDAFETPAFQNDFANVGTPRTPAGPINNLWGGVSVYDWDDTTNLPHRDFLKEFIKICDDTFKKNQGEVKPCSAIVTSIDETNKRYRGTTDTYRAAGFTPAGNPMNGAAVGTGDDVYRRRYVSKRPVVPTPGEPVYYLQDKPRRKHRLGSGYNEERLWYDNRGNADLVQRTLVAVDAGNMTAYSPIPPTSLNTGLLDYMQAPLSSTGAFVGAAGGGTFTNPLLQHPEYNQALIPSFTDKTQIVIVPVAGDEHTKQTRIDAAEDVRVNKNCHRPQFFAMLDASALLWNARHYVNPADTNRPMTDEHGQIDDMHYWSRTMVESFLAAREDAKENHQDEIYEVGVKMVPAEFFPSNFIGSLSEQSFHRLFPLLPKNHKLKNDLRMVRSLNAFWGELPGYHLQKRTFYHTAGAWMPLSVQHQMKLYDLGGLFDHQYKVPKNPWCTHNGNGLARIFNQSYHSVYHTDSYRAPHFKDWQKHVLRYQPPRDGENCFYPFSQYGGTPVIADFVPHRVEVSASHTKARHRQLKYNRFGMTDPIRLGQQFKDTGLLQDLYMPKYRTYAQLSTEQREVAEDAKEHYISNFMAYARNHAILALASCNHGDPDGGASQPRVVRNLYRLYVDTYECMGTTTDGDGVPAVMGFLPLSMQNPDSRPVTLYAGTLVCLNKKLELFCKQHPGSDNCLLYKQTYLNDAAMLFARLLRADQLKILHTKNFVKAQAIRGGAYQREEFNEDLITLQDAYIEFLQTTIIGMLSEGVEKGSLAGAPLHLLEPRELEVSPFDEDTNLVGNDYLTPRTQALLSEIDYTGDTLNTTQLAILSLTPPNHRILGCMKLNQKTDIVDMEHIQKQIQKETIQSNKKVWQKYSEALFAAAFASKLLETKGSYDPSFDLSSIGDTKGPGSFDRFAMANIKNPLTEAAKVQKQYVTNQFPSEYAQWSSSVSMAERSRAQRSSRSDTSVYAKNEKETSEVIQKVKALVEKRHRDTKRPKILVLRDMNLPSSLYRMIKHEYEKDSDIVRYSS